MLFVNAGVNNFEKKSGMEMVFPLTCKIFL